MAKPSPGIRPPRPHDRDSLADAIHDIKAIAQTFPSGAEEPALRIGLNFARVVRKVLPLQALALIRYLNVVTDDALQAGHHQNPAGDFELSTHGSTGVAVNCLCRFVTIEARMLTLDVPPYHVYSDAHLIARDYNNNLFIANDVRGHLEDASYNPQYCRNSPILEFANDALLKHHYQLGRPYDTGNEVSIQNSDDNSEKDNTDEEYI